MPYRAIGKSAAALANLAHSAEEPFAFARPVRARAFTLRPSPSALLGRPAQTKMSTAHLLASGGTELVLVVMEITMVCCGGSGYGCVLIDGGLK